ncbi:hypothetical protein OESDEN_07928 [Oesophagostomum dentatum]|uniref:Uncharacterized protein n=1 Tax=Oesophagostomum dentatum TaxID=61180 RepID=A0A0B1TA15_OESDE|nr:hypothetical protein OESDEN_07928 [Oesophagostomum dentatum]
MDYAEDRVRFFDTNRIVCSFFIQQSALRLIQLKQLLPLYPGNSSAPLSEMASSRGRERLKERQMNGRQFVFGSSTPRDLSHMNKIPTKFRSYDAKVRITREGPGLREYMQKARSLTREGDLPIHLDK